MKILDLSAGNRAIWFDKNNPLCTFLDIRAEVKPDIVCDTRDLSFLKGQIFDLICWDPPHLNFGKNSNMAKCYGYFTTLEILDTIEKTGKEILKLTKDSSLLILKWNDHDIKLKRIFDILPGWVPLFGSLVSKNKRSQTYWVVFRRNL